MLPNNAGQVVVHFGLPKTGSTSIQKSLFRHLSDPRFHYINLGTANANHRIAVGFRPDSKLRIHERRGTSSDELQALRKNALEELEAQLVAAGSRTAILSSEAISGLRQAEIQDLCGLLARHRQAVAAVGYVRRPKEFVESFFQQRLRGGGSLDLSRSLPNFRARFENFEAVLGRENVRIWLFDPASFPGNCVVQDFCARLGISFRPEDVIRANDGISLPALSLLFAYRKFGPGYGAGLTALRENRMLVKRIRKLAGPKLRLHSSLVAPMIEERRRCIDWIEERLGMSLSEDLTAHDESAVRTEEDLLRFMPETLQWLAGELGTDYHRSRHSSVTPREVADWVHLLRLKLANDDQPRRRGAAGAAPQVSRSSASSTLDDECRECD